MATYEKYEHIFDQFGINKDRKISPVEFQHWVNKAIGGELSLSLMEAQALIQSFDEDGDGLLGLQEFVRLLEEGGDEEEEEEQKLKDLQEAFGMYEMEGTGCITAISLKRMLNRLGDERSLDECKVIIGVLDLNGDGFLSFDEFKVMMS